MAIDPRKLQRDPGMLRLVTVALYARIGAVAQPLVAVMGSHRLRALALLGATILLLGGSAGQISDLAYRTDLSRDSGAFAIRGVSYPSYRNGNYASADSTAALAELAKTGANFVAIIPTLASKTIRDSVFFSSGQTESDEHVLRAIADAHALGLAVLLKPHVDPADGKPRAEYAPIDVAAWFRNYQGLLLHYAAMAAATHAEMFSIGCELDTMVGQRYRSQWLDIIRSVRGVYRGPIIYAHSWPGVAEVSFLDAVDYIGVDAYDPLSDARDPSVAELAAGWATVSANPWVASRSHFNSPLENYRSLWRRYHKPIIVTEIGYKSVAGAAGRPGDWKWNGAVDLQLQARAYEAFFEVWSRQVGWVKGAFLWNWEPVVHPERTEGALGWYTPQNKPAASVIARWYRHMAAGAGGAPPADPPVQASR